MTTGRRGAPRRSWAPRCARATWRTAEASAAEPFATGRPPFPACSPRFRGREEPPGRGRCSNPGAADRPRRERRAIMGLLDALLGSGQGREEQQEFLQRFEQGQPWEGYTDQEVLNRYGTVAGQASA